MDAVTHETTKADAGHGIRFSEAFWVWLRVALLSFGGPAGQIAVMHRILVEEKNWISESRFLHALNYCMLLPGPEAQQLATYIGWLLHRTAGGIMAGGLFILPGVIAIMGLSYIYAAYGNVGFVEALFFGLKAAVLAIVIQALIRVGKRALRNRIMVALAAIAFVAIFFFNVPFPIIIIAAGVIGYVGARSGRPEFSGVEHGGSGKAAAIDSMLGEGVPDHVRPSVPRALRVGAFWLAMWLVPVAAILIAFGEANTFSQIALFFSKMAMVTFGGAYAVLAYVAQTGGRALSLAGPARDARRPRHGRDHAGPADHGAAVRRLHGRVPRSRHAVADAGGHARRTAGDVGDVRALLPLDLSRRALHRAAARQQGTRGRALRDHGGRGRRDPQSFDLVRAAHDVPEDHAGALVRLVVRFAGMVEPRLGGAGCWPIAAATAIFRFNVGMLTVLAGSCAAGVLLRWRG